MYREHNLFENPKDSKIRIWRYLDFAKFVSLINDRAVFFARADRFKDPFEGSYCKNVTEVRTEYYRLDEESSPFLIGASEYARAMRSHTLISCWHMNDSESDAMWKLYIKNDPGIAIQSTFERLRDCFNSYQDHSVYIGIVKYIDYDKDTISEGNTFTPYLFKRKAFEHERELRAVIDASRESKHPLSPAHEYGMNVPVDLELLIENIYLSPLSGKWVGDLVESFLNKYKLKVQIRQSNLADRPIY